MRRLLSLVCLSLLLAPPLARSVSNPLPQLLDFRLRGPSMSGEQDYLFSSREPARSEFLLHDYLKRSLATPSGTYLAAHPEQIMGLRRYELTPVASALRAAETGASMALFLGAVGNTLGLFDEKTSWIMMGAAAAAGAAWGATAGYQDPRWRIRYRWEPK